MTAVVVLLVLCSIVSLAVRRENESGELQVVSRLNMVDLAGSERLDRTKAVRRSGLGVASAFTLTRTGVFIPGGRTNEGGCDNQLVFVMPWPCNVRVAKQTKGVNENKATHSLPRQQAHAASAGLPEYVAEALMCGDSS